MTSVIPSLVVSVVPGVCSCAQVATEVPPRMAATAYEIFDFICVPPQKPGIAASPASPAYRWKMMPGSRDGIYNAALLKDGRTRMIAVAGSLGLQPPAGGRETVRILELPGEVCAVSEARLVGDVG